MNSLRAILDRIRGSKWEDLLLSLAALLLFLLAIGYTVFAVRSLAKRTADAFLQGAPTAGPAITFDIDKLEPLIKAGKLKR